MSNLIQLFQLVDSSLPIGGFVYSMGMESAIKSKLLQNEAGFQEINHPKKWNQITSAYQAMLMNPNLEKSALVLGKNWSRLLFTLYTSEKVTKLKNQLKEEQTPLYFTIVFGMFMSVLNISIAEARSMYLYTALRDQITALTRLGIVGPNGGQGLLTHILEQANLKNETYKSVPYEKATKSAYIMEITQLNHNKVYSKLFQN